MPDFGLSLMPEPAFAAAALPLFDEGLVDVLEWSFDMGWGRTPTPDWVDGLLDDYALSGDLIGHGVSYSVLAGQPTEHDRWWLTRLEDEVERRNYRHISEHLGFLGAGNFSFAAPMPMPRCARTVAIGRSRLAALAERCGLPIGLENLATSLGPTDALEQGHFLEELLEPFDGFVVLDLHNLWCQSMNTGLALLTLLDTYPLHRVREIHLSGGSWDERPGRATPVRRDTHDDLVPDELIELFRAVAPRCAALETVVYERLGPTLEDPSTHEPFRDDVRRVASLVTEVAS